MHTNVLHCIADTAVTDPARLAIAGLRRRVSYSELHGDVARLAVRLDVVAPAAARVVTLLDPDEDLVTSALAVMGSGKVFVPMDPGLPAGRIAALLQLVEPAAIVSSAPWQAKIHEILQQPDLGGIALVDVATTDRSPASLTSPRDSEGGYIYFTSGSTGTPKAVLGRMGGLLHFIDWESRYLGVQTTDRISLITPQMFDPFLRDMLLPLCNGAALCIPERSLIYAPAGLLDWFDRNHITITHMIPSLFQVLMEQPAAGRGLRHLRHAVLAGEMLRGSVVQMFHDLRLPNAGLVNLYGPTETTLAKMAYRVTAEDAHRATVPVGWPIDDTSVSLIGDDGMPVDPGATGEVFITTDHMSAGYLNGSAEDRQRFLQDATGSGRPSYRTGDLGRLMADGALELLGRADFQIKIDGQRIELGEIEATLERHPAISQAVVLGVEVDAGQFGLVAFLRLASSHGPNLEALRDYLAEQLPPAMIPGQFRCLDAFPRLANGKLDRRALAARILQRDEGLGEYAPPLDAEARQIADIWADYLKVDRIGLNDSFFALGGTSLQAIRMLAAVCVRRGIDRPFIDFFRNPRISDLMQHRARDAQTALQSAAETPRPPSLQGPATLEQQRIYWMQSLGLEQALFNMAYIAQWDGALQPDLLRLAAQRVLDRHPALRTLFHLDGAELIACVQTDVDVPFSCQQSDGGPDWIAAHAAAAFALGRAPLFRLDVAQQAVDRFQLLLSLHHIVGDAWSVDMLWRDLVAEYRRLISGEGADADTASADRAACDIFAFAAEQRRQLADPSFDGLRQYWRGLLAAPLPMLQLPYDHRPATTPTGRGARLGFTLPPDLSAALRQVSVKHGTTPYMTFLTIFAAFLHRYSHQDDLVIGTPVTNRPTGELQDLVGFFVNILVVRLKPQPRSGFAELLDHVQSYVLAALEKGQMPFDRLVEDINPARSIGVSPLFQAMFAYQDAPPEAQQIGAATLASPRQVDTGCSKYELTLEITDEGAVFGGVFEYSQDRFEPDTIERMCRNFQVFVQAIVTDVDAPIGQHALVSPAEYKLIAGWNAKETPFSDGLAIHQLIEAQADRTPDVIAALFEDQALTYRALDEAANRLAHLLIQRGAGPGIAVGLSLDRSLDLVIGFLAILKSGGIYVPVDPGYPAARIRLMIEDAEVKLLLTGKRHRNIGADFDLETILIDDDAPVVLAQSAARPPCPVGGDAIAYIIYTSGSTGRPKGVLVPHRGVCNLAEAEVQLLDMAAGSRVLQFASFSFDTSIWEIVMTLCAGGTLVMASSQDLMPGPDLLATVRKQRVTHLTLPPSALAAMPYADLPDLKVLITAGEACGVELVRRWGRGRRFFNSYGPTEATVSASNAELFVDSPRVHIGRALNNTQIWLLDGYGEVVPIGVAGELHIGGVGVTAGYHRRSDLTAERFVPDRFSVRENARLYRSGDLARYLPDGNIDYLGRVDQQIKLRGFRVELGEIESAMHGFTGVIDAVAMVRADYLDASAVVAYVLAETPDALDTDALRLHLQAQLPDFMVPTHLEIMAQFPRLPNGKVDRNGFPTPRKAAVIPPDEQTPEGEIEWAVATIWGRLLGLSAINREASFFEMGGHSLLAAQAVSLLAAEFDLNLRVQDIFIGRSVAGVAARARRQGPAVMPAPNATASAPLSFAQQRMWFLQHSDPDAAHYNIAVTRHLRDVTPQRLEAAWSSLLARHPVFNTRITIRDGRPCQYIDDRPLQVRHDLLENAGQTFKQELDALADQEARVPFDLAGPLYRLRIVGDGDGQSGFVLVVHHLLIDDASLTIVNSDLDALLGDAALLPASATSYLDFALWEHEARQGSGHERQLDYWRGVFSSPPPVIALPTDAHAATEDHRGAVIAFPIDTDTSQALHLLAKQQGTTPFVVMLAAYQALLYRYSGERDLCIGVPVSVREMPQWHGLVGLFLNTVALRHEVDPEASFAENLESLKHDWGAALDHSQVPFDSVVAAIDPNRDSGELPLFRTMLVYRHGDPIQASGMQSVENGTAKFDLTCFVDDFGDSMRCAFEYRTGLFEAETIRRLGAHFRRLLDGIARDPATALHALPLLSQEERRDVLTRGLGPDMPVPAGTVTDWIQAQIDSNPDAVAVFDGDEALTYAELGRRAEVLADQLRALGIGKGDRVALKLPRSAQWVLSILGVLKCGAAYVPIDPEYPAERVDYILRDCASRAVIGPDGVMAATEAPVGPALGARDGYGPAYVIYTSGSTGQPKGVVVSHAALANYVAHAASCYGGEGDVPMHTSVSFDATITSLFVPLIRGQTLRVVREEDEVEHLAALWGGPAPLSIVKLTPAHMELLGRILPPTAAGNARGLVVGGEALHSSAIDFWRKHAPQVRIINEYGPTEATVGCCIFDIAAGEAPRQGDMPIGRAIANTRLYVLDEFRQPVPVGVVGELYIGGAGVAEGYLNKPELTAQRFVPDPYADHPEARMYRTGDLVKQGADGQMLFIGRRDDQIKLRGYRIELGEIEAALRDQSEVEDAAVAVISRHGRLQLVGFVVTRDAIDLNELLARLGRALPHYMIPNRLSRVAEMPLTANGKVDRKALAAADPDVTETRIDDPEQPVSPLEKTLLTIWQDVLRLDRIGLHDNFFAIGGDSILSLQIVFKAREAGLSIKPRMLFDYPSISSLATVVAPLHSAPEEQVPTVGDTVDLSPIQRWFFAHHPEDPHHFNQAFAFDVDPGLDPDILQAALADVIAHHDALRLCFKQEQGEWQATIAANPVGPVLERVEGLDTVEAIIAQRQSMFDLGSGRLVHGVLARDGSRAVLVILAHHLVIDGVSWRILAEDLARYYAQRAAGQTPCLTRRTASYASWTRHLLDLRASPALTDERSFWQQQLAGKVASFPPAPAGAENTYAKARKRHVTFGADVTEALLTRAPHAYRANAGDLLLAALAATLRDWLGDPRLLIDLESHGRDLLGDDPPDTSRTVGWFTAIHPLLIDADIGGDYGALVRGVKDGRRLAPNHGIGYGLLRHAKGETALDDLPQAQVCFNYLGRFDQAFVQLPLRGVAELDLGPRHAGSNPRPYQLEVDAFVHGDSLTVEWTFGSELLEDAAVGSWMAAFQRHLHETVEHCLGISAPRYTASDFCAVQFDNAAIDVLQAAGPDLQDVYPLSSTQEGMLFHAISAPGSGYYFEQLVFRVRDDLTPATLRQAFAKLMQRHEVLRTTFAADIADRPIQVVRAWPSVDWRTLRVADAAAFSEWLAQDRAQGFDLDAAPPWRVGMVSTERGDSWLVFSHHHILLDGWSVSLLIDELQDLVAVPNERPPKPRRFRDHVQRQRKQAVANRAYWQNRLAGIGSATPLPLARFNAKGPDDVARVTLDVPTDLDARLKAFALRQGVTLATLAQAAWALLLHCYTGQRDCLFGVTVSGRAGDMAGVESMLGLFIATLPKRVPVDPDQPVLTWLQTIQNDHLEDESHADLSLAEVKAATGLNLGGPLFESLLVFENYPARSRATQLLDFDRAHERTSYPLSVVLSPRQGLHGHIDYDLRHYDKATVRRLGAHFIAILDRLAEGGACRLSDLAAPSEADRRQLIDAWRSDRPAAPPATAHGLFEQQARLTPAAPALEYEGLRLSYQQLNARAELMADHLRARGIGPGNIVALFLPRSAELVIAVLAVMKSGAAYLPIDAGYPAERVRMLLEDSGAALLLTVSALSAKGSGAVPAWLLDEEQAAQGSGPSPRSAGPQDLAYVIYTSGSTGKPKGVLIEHASLVNYLCDARERYQVGPGMRSALHSSISFDATITSLLVPLVAGAEVVVLPEDADTNSLAEYLARETAPQLLKITPVNLEMLGASASATALARVKSLVVGGEALRDSALRGWRQAAPELRVFNEYGPTETVVGCCVFMFEADKHFDGDVPIGRPIAGTDLFILDPDLKPVPFGCTGELYIGGAGLARGYLGRPELTAERFVSVALDGDRRLYRTGDLVRALPDGNLFYEGRCDSQIKLRGYRIEPGEIEGQLRTLPDIRQATVVLQEQVLVAYVVAEPDDFAALRLRNYLSDRLPHHMVPGIFIRLDAIPQTPNGKIDVKALPAPSIAPSSAGRGPGDRLESSLCAIWEEVLQCPRIGIDDHFFELGGHSLTALRITARIARQLAVRISLKTFFDRPTIAALADEIRRLQAAPDTERGTISVPITRRRRRMSDPAGAVRRRSDVDV